MRDIKRIPIILAKLQQVWEMYPDLRLGQLIDNLTNPVPIRMQEDDILERTLDHEIAYPKPYILPKV